MPEPGPFTILLVDDDESSRRATALLLRDAGFHVREASCGADALRLRTEPSDLFLLDVGLPDMTGFELCARLRAETATASVPVLLLTGVYRSSEDRAQGLEGGADAYLTKPVDPRELIAQARALVRLHRRLAALEEQLRHRNEELARHNERVQEMSRHKSAFLAGMSHELRTPLNGIIGFAELMHDGRVGPISAQHKEYLGDVLTSARHLLQLINQVLDLSKVEAGIIDLRPEEVDPAQVVGEVRAVLRSLAAQKRIAVEVRVDPGLGRVVVDPARLKQVLYNYLSNALKFTPEDGRVEVRLGPEGADAFRLEVADTGIGIKPDDVARLFVEFQRLTGSSGPQYPGTGLGLALTRRLVEAQGGRVGVESTPGQGSRFFAVLPRQTGPGPGAGTPAPAAPPLPAGAGAPAVLIIEHGAEHRAWLAETLTRAGYAVQAAASGAAAVELCRGRAFDAVTLDPLLPDMHGRDVLRAIQSGGPNASTPVILLTVAAGRGAAAGFTIHDFLVKPVPAEELCASLQRAGVAPALHRTILVVDDDPAALKVMEVTLRHLGYRPVCAPGGEAGLAAAGRERPAAVVLDLMMPGIDGFEFLDRYRRTAPGRLTPVIVWTVKDLSAEDHVRLRAMAQGLVMKHRNGEDLLLQELRNLLGPHPKG